MATAAKPSNPAKTAGVLFLLIGILRACIIPVGMASGIIISIGALLDCAVYFLFAFFLLRRQRGMLLLIPPCVSLLLSLATLQYGTTILWMLASVSLPLVLFLNFRGRALKLWFVPCAFQGLSTVLSVLQTVAMLSQIGDLGGNGFNLFFIMRNIVTEILYAVALWPMMRWVSHPEISTPAPEPAPQYGAPPQSGGDALRYDGPSQPEYTQYAAPQIPVTPQAPTTPPVQPDYSRLDEDTAAALRKYKGFLDCGIITQEEFDAKRRKLLDL